MANNNKQPLIASIVVAAAVWCFFLDVSGAEQSGGGDDGGAAALEAFAGGGMTCMETLQPCQKFLAEESTAEPSPECCAPMKEVITKEKDCLCSLFQNAALLHSVNITQDNALRLAKKCGADADPSLCKSSGNINININFVSIINNYIYISNYIMFELVVGAHSPLANQSKADASHSSTSNSKLAKCCYISAAFMWQL